MVWNLPEGSRVLLDACCLINLLATECLEEILRALPHEFATSRFVAAHEVLSLSSGLDFGGPLERELISSKRLEHTGCLTILETSTEEERAVIARLNEEMGDGEATVCALAVTRGGAVATDDRKALRGMSRLAPEVPTLQTPELLFEWARISRASNDQVGKILRAVRQRARFYPHRNAPRFEWWERFSL
jgi:hypothetical protein